MNQMKACDWCRWLLAAALLVPLKAEILCTLGPGASSYTPAADQRPASDAMQLANRVNAAVKTVCGSQCPTMAVLRNATAPNVMLVADAGHAKLVYSPQFFATAYDSFGDDGIVAVIAHEVGHALDATMGAAWIKKGWTSELRADAWAGCLLARLDPSPGNLQPILSALSKYPPPSHPSWNLRLPAIRAGYTNCGGTASFDFSSGKTKPR
jgi:hypothetical protein